ncbi:hypothetical protein K501DRAFT_269015 [Backusella circina FSU 941]|nr:hypothetical protein K501DRAFT_269015 [Backusella circina FSU 941]
MVVLHTRLHISLAKTILIDIKSAFRYLFHIRNSNRHTYTKSSNNNKNTQFKVCNLKEETEIIYQVTLYLESIALVVLDGMILFPTSIDLSSSNNTFNNKAFQTFQYPDSTAKRPDEDVTYLYTTTFFTTNDGLYVQLPKCLNHDCGNFHLPGNQPIVDFLSAYISV